MVFNFGLLLIIGVQCLNTIEASCPCSLTYSPVCGSDGVTYYNECIFECERKDAGKPIHKVKDSACIECGCPFVHKPVCGSDGVTYANECSFNCTKKNTPSITIASEGKCPMQ